MDSVARPRLIRIAAIAWCLAAIGWLVDEALSASAFPRYSYATNYISDLGIPDVGTFQGRAIDSPLHVLMNATFIGQGALFAVAGVLVAVAVAVTAGPRRTVLVLALVHGVGLLLVGTIHGSQANVENGTAVFHVIGAAMAILAGNAVAILAGLGSRSLGLSAAYRVVSVVLGTLGVVSLVMLVVDSGSTVVNILPDGVWERGSVYTVIAWELLTGVLLLRDARGRRVLSGAGA